jgi:Protein of unknown function (DUF5661)
MTDKGPFSHFDRGTVEAAMKMLGIPDYMLSGESRRNDYANVMDFETFDTLSDPVEYFGKAMTIELEHGKAATSVGANVTNDDTLATARIAKAHLFGVEYGDQAAGYEPFPTYYDFLMWMELLHATAVKTRKHVI